MTKDELRINNQILDLESEIAAARETLRRREDEDRRTLNAILDWRKKIDRLYEKKMTIARERKEQRKYL
jgi:hypothetical protein